MVPDFISSSLGAELSGKACRDECSVDQILCRWRIPCGTGEGCVFSCRKAGTACSLAQMFLPDGCAMEWEPERCSPVCFDLARKSEQVKDLFV